MLPQPLATTIHRAFVKSKVPASAGVVAEVFNKLCKNLQNCTILIDGLDCLTESEVLGFLKFLRQYFQTGTSMQNSARWLIFCRDTLGRGIRLESVTQSQCFHIDLRHVKRDLHQYIDHEVELRRNESTRITNENTILKIKTVLKDNCEKM